MAPDYGGFGYSKSDSLSWEEQSFAHEIPHYRHMSNSKQTKKSINVASNDFVRSTTRCGIRSKPLSLNTSDTMPTMDNFKTKRLQTVRAGRPAALTTLPHPKYTQREPSSSTPVEQYTGIIYDRQSSRTPRDKRSRSASPDYTERSGSPRIRDYRQEDMLHQACNGMRHTSSTVAAADQCSQVDYATVLAAAAYKRGMKYDMYDKPEDIASKLRIKGYEQARIQANAPTLLRVDRVNPVEIDAYIKTCDQERAHRVAYVKALSAKTYGSPESTPSVAFQDIGVFMHPEETQSQDNCRTNTSTDASNNFKLNHGYASDVDSNHKKVSTTYPSCSVDHDDKVVPETSSKSVKAPTKSSDLENTPQIGLDDEGYIESVGKQCDGVLSPSASNMDVALDASVSQNALSNDKILDLEDELQKSYPSNLVGDDTALCEDDLLRDGSDKVDKRGVPSQGNLMNDEIKRSDEADVLAKDHLLNTSIAYTDSASLFTPENLSNKSTEQLNSRNAPTRDISPSTLAKLPDTGKTASLAYTLALLTPEDLEAHQRLSALSSHECMSRLKTFLKQNSTLLESYKLQFITRVDSNGAKMKYPVLSPAWYSMSNRVEICGAIKWLDALLQNLRKVILAEDEDVLLPQLRNMETQRSKLEKNDEDERKRRLLDSDKKEKQRRKEFDDASEKKWRSFHKHYEAVKNSNTRRNKLLAATGFDPSLLHEIAFSAYLIAVNDPHVDTEELSIEALRLALSRVLNTIRLNDYCLLKGPEREPMTHPDLVTIRPDFCDGLRDCSMEDLKNLDALTPQHSDSLDQMSNLQASHYQHTRTFGSEDDEEEFDFSDQEMEKVDWATNFPPQCWSYLPRGETVRVAVDKKYIAQKDEWLTKRDNMKPLSDLTQTELQIWMRGNLSNVGALREVIDEAMDELKEFASTPEHLQDDFTEEYIKDLKKKQVWFRDQAIMVLRKMRRDLKNWHESPSRKINYTNTDDIVNLECDIQKIEAVVMEVQRSVPVAFPWITGLCSKVNKRSGCKDLQDGVCPFSHDHAGRVCKVYSNGEKCPYGDNCSYRHWSEGDEIGCRPNTPMSARSFAGPAFSAGTSFKSARPCPVVNKPEGCPDQNECPYNHHNYGTICQKFLEGACTWNEKCAFVHPALDNAKPFTAPCRVPNMDLRAILDQVLQNPKKFKVCMFVNKGIGCFKLKFQGQCDHNHTLAGIACPDDDGSGSCFRRETCPLKHGLNAFTTQPVRPGKRQAEEPLVQGSATCAKRLRSSEPPSDALTRPKGHNRQQRQQQQEILPSPPDTLRNPKGNYSGTFHGGQCQQSPQQQTSQRSKSVPKGPCNAAVQPYQAQRGPTPGQQTQQQWPHQAPLHAPKAPRYSAGQMYQASHGPAQSKQSHQPASHQQPSPKTQPDFNNQPTQYSILGAATASQQHQWQIDQQHTSLPPPAGRGHKRGRIDEDVEMEDACDTHEQQQKRTKPNNKTSESKRRNKNSGRGRGRSGGG